MKGWRDARNEKAATEFHSATAVCPTLKNDSSKSNDEKPSLRHAAVMAVRIGHRGIISIQKFRFLATRNGKNWEGVRCHSRLTVERRILQLPQPK
jgi:hypothetical protein